MTSHPIDELPCGVIGSGRVGQAMAGLLAGLGHPVVAVTDSASLRIQPEALSGVARESAAEVVDRSQLVVIAVPDDALVEVAADAGLPWRPGQIVFHTSGAHGVSVLQPVADRGAFAAAVHPAMTFTGTGLDVARMAGASFAITANPLVVPVLATLVSSAGGVPLVVPEASRSAYHAALCHAANNAVTLVSQARELLKASGVADPGAVLRPLVTAAVDAASDDGVMALTGPVARADLGTVRRHVTQLRQLVADGAVAQEVLTSYQQMALATARHAAQLGQVAPGVVPQVAAVVEPVLPEGVADCDNG